MSFAVGPFAFALGTVVVAAALLAAAAAGWLATRGKGPSIAGVLGDMAIAGLLVARAAFVVRWSAQYRQEPWSILDIRDGGFEAWPGIAAALAVAAWFAWRRAGLRKPLAIGVAAGAVTAGILVTLVGSAQGPDAPRLPDIAVATLEGGVTTLPALPSPGMPTVVNLWATWCPPCRREMPVLAAAQAREKSIRFVFANQGEDAAAVSRYLSAAALPLANVVLDASSSIGRQVGSAGLPTTLFYDASGRLVDVHMGPLSSASLASKLGRLR